MAGLVDIVLPSGEQATVPQADLAQAQAAGAHVQTSDEADRREAGGLVGTLSAAALGAGRTATFGLSDQWLGELANVTQGATKDLGIQGSAAAAGLDVGRKDMMHALALAKEANPYSNMAGEAAGLFLGPGGGISATGEVLEHGVTSALGEGLAGKALSMGVRGAGEGAMLGALGAETEARLGDTQLNGEHLAASMAKDALIGGVAGAGLGAGMFGLGRAAEGVGAAFSKARGPVSDAVLDEIAGVEGAGRAIQKDAKASQALIDDMMKTGVTSEQASKMADELNTITRAKADSGPLSGFMDSAADMYAARRAGGNAELQAVLKKGYAERSSRIADMEAAFDSRARLMAERGTKVMRNLEDTANEVHFTERPDQMAKLVDPTKYTLARDSAIRMGQEVLGAVDMLESTATRGGGDVAVRKLQKELVDFGTKMERLSAEGSATETRDAFINAYKLKQAVGKHAGFGKPPFLRTAAENEFAAVYEKLRTGLEDESVWGGAGAATREWNESFSSAFGRRKDFGTRFSVSIDEAAGGIPTPEIDAGKVKGFLKQLGGAEGDQGVKTTESFIDGMRNRIDKIEAHGDLTPAQRAKITAGRAELAEFEQAFKDARKDAEVLNSLKRQQLQEQGKGIGGLLGLGAEFVTKPLTTMERLAQVRATTKKVEDAIAKGFEKFFGKKGAYGAAAEAASDVKPRPKDVVVKDIGEVKTLASNPAALQEKTRLMLGDLGKYAPEIAAHAQASLQRAIAWLAQEAPKPAASIGVLAVNAGKPRYSDQQIHEWETKKRAAFDPHGTVVADLQKGKLNREAIRTIEFVSPALFANMQMLAHDYLEKVASEGKLDGLPYQQRAAYATLLKVPADGTWKPDFIAMMQAAKSPVVMTPPPGAPVPMGTVSKRAVKFNTDVYATPAQAIEAGGGV